MTAHTLSIYSLRVHASKPLCTGHGISCLGTRTYFWTITLFVTSTVRPLQTISREIYLLKICVYFMFASRVKNVTLISSSIIYVAQQHYVTSINCAQMWKIRVTMFLREHTQAEESDAPSVKSDQPISRNFALLLRCREQRFPKWGAVVPLAAVKIFPKGAEYVTPKNMLH